MTKLIITTILILICALCVPIIRNEMRYQVNPFEAALISIMDDTRWAPGYTDHLFKSIELGSSATQVQDILGPALYTNTYEGKVIWHYTVGWNGKSQSSADGSTHVRGIWFDKDMKVKEKLYYFYFD